MDYISMKQDARVRSNAHIWKALQISIPANLTAYRQLLKCTYLYLWVNPEEKCWQLWITMESYFFFPLGLK